MAQPSFKVLPTEESIQPQAKPLKSQQNGFLHDILTEKEVARRLSAKLAEKGVDLSIARVFVNSDPPNDSDPLHGGRWKNSNPLSVFAKYLFQFAQDNLASEVGLNSDLLNEARLDSKIDAVASALQEIQKSAGTAPDADYANYVLRIEKFLESGVFDAMPDKGRSQFEISGAAYSFGILSDPEVAKAFVERPENFVEFLKFCPSSKIKDNAFGLFILDDDAYRNGFGRSKSSRDGLLDVFKKADIEFVRILGKAWYDNNFPDDYIVADTLSYFQRHRKETMELLSLSSFDTVYYLIIDERINSFFEKEPQFFIDVAKIMGKDADAAFRFMWLPVSYALDKLFPSGRIYSAKELIERDEFRKDNPYYAYVLENKERYLSAFRSIASAIGSPEIKPYQETWISSAFASFDYAAHCELPSEWAQALFDAQHLIEAGSFKGKDAAFVCLAVEMDCVSSLRTDDEKISKIKDILRVLEERGIEFYYRYTPKIIENVYRTAIEPGFSEGERNGFPIKNALIVVSKSDWNGAFSRMQDSIEPLIDHGYNIMLCESETDAEVEKRLLNNGLLQMNGEPVKYDLLVLVAHGHKDGMLFGDEWTPQSHLSRSDFFPQLEESGMKDAFLPPYGNKLGGYMMEDWASMFNNDAKAILISCSTGKEEYQPNFLKTREYMGNIWNAGNYRNIAQAISDKAKIGVFAPTEPTFLREIFFDESGRVSNVAYGYKEPPFGEAGSTTNYIDESRTR